MQCEMSMQRKGEYLRVRYADTFVSVAQARQVIVDIRDECKRTGCTRVFVDMAHVVGKMSVLERYELGVYAASVWDCQIRVACVAPPKEYDGFFHTVARNRGANVCVTLDPKKAMEWLMEEDGRQV